MSGAAKNTTTGSITIAALEARAKEYERHAAKLRRVLNQLRTLAVIDLGDGPAIAGTVSALRAPAPKRRGAALAALEILRAAGRPMRAAEILPEVQRLGVVVGGQKPAATLASTLLKYPGITSSERGLFIPADGAGTKAQPKKPGRKKPGRKKGATKKTAAKKKVAKKKVAKKKVAKKIAKKTAAKKKTTKKTAKKTAAKKTAAKKKTTKKTAGAK